jgi:zinc/manganese transport system substrate-binding protein
MKLFKISSRLFLVSLVTLSPIGAQAKLSIVTTTTDLRSIVESVGKSLVSVESISKGTQDPHFIEAKPSFMLKASRADLLVAIGLELEIGWLPSIVRGARNPKINVGQKGYFEVGPLVKTLEQPTGTVTRAEGDVHPFGNPHITLDPIRVGEISIKVAERLGELDSANAAAFKKNAQEFQAHLVSKTAEWQKRIAATGVKDIVTYHKTLTYFLNRFQISNPSILEPKPGIPPTTSHVLAVIQIIKEKKVPLILVENFFDPTITNKIKAEVPAIRAETVPVAVEGQPGIRSLEDLYEYLVKKVEGK